MDPLPAAWRSGEIRIASERIVRRGAGTETARFVLALDLGMRRLRDLDAEEHGAKQQQGHALRQPRSLTTVAKCTHDAGRSNRGMML